MIILAASLTEWGVIIGIVVGGGGALAALRDIYKAKPETQTLVMSTGETGVKILDGVIDTLQSELARRDAAIERCEQVIDERNNRIAELVAEREAIVRQREQRI